MTDYIYPRERTIHGDYQTFGPVLGANNFAYFPECVVTPAAGNPYQLFEEDVRKRIHTIIGFRVICRVASAQVNNVYMTISGKNHHLTWSNVIGTDAYSNDYFHMYRVYEDTTITFYVPSMITFHVSSYFIFLPKKI